MSKYYALIAGLPNISLEDTKVNYTLLSFREELDSILTSSDIKLINLYFNKFDNKNLKSYFRFRDLDPDPRGRITYEEYQTLIQTLKEGGKAPKNSKLPAYFAQFLSVYLANQDSPELITWEDYLASLYYAYAMKCSNKFVSEWFELNLNINNILSAITCRKFGWDKKAYIIGNNKVAESIRSSNARDFGLGDEVDYLPELIRIAEEPDLTLREKKLDVLKWNWLDEKTFFKTFDIESVFAYMLKLEMIERWVTLDKEAGEKTFRELVKGMKKGSVSALEEFKRNNNK